MNKRSLLAIEQIISCINKLVVLTKNITEEEFYDSSLIVALLDLLNEIDLNINKISIKIKNKYRNIAWDIIKKEKFVDEFFGESINLGKAFELSQKVLKDNFLEDLIKLLENELPIYYKEIYK